MSLPNFHLTLHEAPVGSRWEHVKTGGIYTVTGHAMIESTWRPGVIYVGAQHVLIVRDAEEFTDGRFRRVDVH